jgi:hypothetical protein
VVQAFLRPNGIRGPVPGVSIGVDVGQGLGADPAAQPAMRGEFAVVQWRKRRRCRTEVCPRASFTEQVAQMPDGMRTTTRLRTALAVAVEDGRDQSEAAASHGVSWPTVQRAVVARGRSSWPIRSRSRSGWWGWTRPGSGGRGGHLSDASMFLTTIDAAPRNGVVVPSSTAGAGRAAFEALPAAGFSLGRGAVQVMPLVAPRPFVPPGAGRSVSTLFSAGAGSCTFRGADATFAAAPSPAVSPSPLR